MQAFKRKPNRQLALLHWWSSIQGSSAEPGPAETECVPQTYLKSQDDKKALAAELISLSLVTVGLHPRELEKEGEVDLNCEFA